MIEHAGTYATLTGLLSAFNSSRNSTRNNEITEFIAWLIEHNHTEIVKGINDDHATTVFIKAFLNHEIPEIHTKLDAVITLIHTLIERQRLEEDIAINEPLNSHYIKSMITFLFEQFKSHKLSSSNFDHALDLTNELLDRHAPNINKYVLERMIRDCLESRTSATEIIHSHWDNLINN